MIPGVLWPITAVTPPPEFMGYMVMALMALLTWYYLYRGNQRAEDAAVEPRHTPAVERKIEERAQILERRITEEVSGLRYENKLETDKLHGRVSGLRDEVRGELTLLGDRLESRLQSATQSWSDTAGAIRESQGKIQASIENLSELQAETRARVNYLSDKSKS